VLRSKTSGQLSAVLVHGPELPQLYLATFRNGGLSGQTAEDQLAGGVDPVRWQGADYLAPYPLFEGIKVCRRLRPTGTGDQHRNNSERS
jgi:hypothetical protein